MGKAVRICCDLCCARTHRSSRSESAIRRKWWLYMNVCVSVGIGKWPNRHYQGHKAELVLHPGCASLFLISFYIRISNKSTIIVHKNEKHIIKKKHSKIMFKCSSTSTTRLMFSFRVSNIHLLRQMVIGKLKKKLMYFWILKLLIWWL